MLKKDFDKLKKDAKKKKALQHSMLEFALANSNQVAASEVTVQPALKYPGFSGTFVWGTALAVFLIVLII